jgi:hypothetical protein
MMILFGSVHVAPAFAHNDDERKCNYFSFGLACFCFCCSTILLVIKQKLAVILQIEGIYGSARDALKQKQRKIVFFCSLTPQPLES